MGRDYIRSIGGISVDDARAKRHQPPATVLVGLLPITVAALVGVIAPRVVLPGADFYFLTLVLIPLALAVATMKKEAAPTTAHAAPPLM